MASPVNRFAPPSDMPVESATFAAMSAAFWPGSDNIGQTDWPTATTLAGSTVLPSPRHHSDELPHGLAHGCGCQHDCRLRIAEHGLETLGVSGQLRCEKRDRDVPGLDGGEEARHDVPTRVQIWVCRWAVSPTTSDMRGSTTHKAKLRRFFGLPAHSTR